MSTTSSTATAFNSNSNQHNIATFAGAVGSSFGFLSVVALALCISIRCRRHRARVRENRVREAFAENFTALDHGEYGPDDHEEGGIDRQRGDGPVMVQANPAPFVPRYFPGSLPASPPPYISEGGDRVVAISPITTSINRAGLPVAVPSTLPPMIALPTATLDLQRTTTNNSSTSYADRPPPTPPDEDVRFSLFGPSGVREDRNLNGGIIGPLPIDTPSHEESDPMLSVEVDDEDEEENGPQAQAQREADADSISSRTFESSRSSRGSSLDEPSGTTPSSAYAAHSVPTSSASSESVTPEMRPKYDDAAVSGTSPTLSTSTSLPSFSAPSSRLLSSPSFPDLAAKPFFSSGLSSLAYPVLHPSRIPLPPSIYGTDVGSQESLERRDCRT
ncbi:hypothetical protein ACEPAF_9016 [Sanghuangporus sanghuang]